jgi:DNA polymerase iota
MIGLDELFLDITDQVNSHLESIVSLHPPLDSEITFEIDPQDHPSPRSFTYPFGKFTGFLEPSSDPVISTTIPYSSLQLFAASYFSQHIREELFASLGYTTSAGIASTKLVAKLLSDLHKPALQSLQNPYATAEAQQSWLDTFKVEKLNGFGFRIGGILRHKLLGEELPVKGTFGDPDKVNGSFVVEEEAEGGEDESGDAVLGYSDAVLNGRPHVAGKLTVGKVRTSSTANDFIAWFGTRLGPRLRDLLSGIDDTEVIPTPAFPKQISVEDSYPDNRSVVVLMQNLAILTKSLVRRLDFELRVGDTYVRFPRTLRLSMRNGRQMGRESKSARMPVELFDSSIPTEKRVELVGRTVNMLARNIMGGWVPGWRVGVINVAATDLIDERPERGIQGFIDKPRREDEIDWDVIRELPEDIRAEVMRQYHLSPEKLNIGQSEVKVDAEATEDDEMEWEDDTEEMEDTKEKCGICGVRIFSWMTDAHARYHESEQS